MLRVCRLGGNFLNKKSYLIFLKKYVIIYIQKKKKIKNMGATKPQCKKRFEKTSSADTAAVVKWG